MSFSQTRPPTSELVELHVFYVPEAVWNYTLNTVSADLTSKFISAGFIRVPRHVTLRALREQLGDFLGEDAVADKFIFLKHIGKKLAVVKAKQETELKLKLFAPPHALHPELYLLPGVDHLEIAYSSSTTPDTQHFNAESHRSPHGPSTLNLPKKEPEKSPTFLESPQKNTLMQNQEDSSSLGWNETEKEMISVMHIKPEQSLNNRTQEKQIPHRRKDQIGSNGSLQVPSSLNSTKWESGKNPTSLESAQKNHLSQDQNESNTLRWSQKDRGTISGHHVKQSIEQAKNNETQENPIPPGRKEEIPIVMGANVENRGNLKAIRMGRNTTGDSGIPESLEDGDKEYLHNKKSPQQSGIRESVTDVGIKQDDKTDKNNVNRLEYSSQYISPPPPPSLSINRSQVPIFQTEKSKMVEQLKQMKAERRHMERTREELVKKAKGLLEQNKLRRYHDQTEMLSCIARDAWKKKYFETKKATASLEDILNKLRQDVELYYQKLLLQLEARDIRKRPNNLTHIANAKNTTIIQITIVQHEIDQLKRKLDNTKMKLITEIKMRKQAASDLRALRAELAQKKIQSSLILQSETPVF
ncbi:spermatogenesis-associated protein 1 isoform X1 [Gopherus flavomarginatus]|uniref:spermatogenesis-associated protein 1 isoform X1 n=1 Tax=Gopherus flavomarginatus TaxID=286002 RepID=UPI0021CC1797|nr:spermatogenesis-associated protein 1 isoform X1 [Gopherus flavomarginatus]XP_050818129.1 spermatogenesis-associated protein 1 isoform X1 [Gopherus flavomarginatus]